MQPFRRVAREEAVVAGDAKERRTLTDAVERMWSQALVAVSSVEEEAAQVVQRLQSVAGWSQDEVRRQVAEVSERLAAQRQALEKGLEDGVRRAVSRLRVPRREQIQALQARLDTIADRLEKLAQRRPPN
jgi:polyhydroxyalkanoate synthesis regulator phasin